MGYYKEFKEVSELCQHYMNEVILDLNVDFKQHEFI